ncbi:MAG: inositol monophosphatase family protein [Solirubrobacteraceae bacterium]|jgi:histidinol-phosphatase
MATAGADLALALELADIADAITMQRYRASDLLIEIKPDMTPVTESDRAVELSLRERIAVVSPDDAVIGEEFGSSGDGHSRSWIIDPIDGTKSYVRGVPTWSTLIGLQVDGEITTGVVSMPALGRRWWASAGAGAFADGRQVHVSAVPALAQSQLAWSGIEDWDEIGRLDAIIALARACWRSRGIGDAWQYMLVAEGAAEIALDPVVSIWDLAALKVIIEEAGGRFSDLAGVGTIFGGNGIASNGLVHDAALAHVGTSAPAHRQLP